MSDPTLTESTIPPHPNGIAPRDGPPVHSFDPDSSPQAKAAAAGKARDQLNSAIRPAEEPNEGAKELEVDVSRGPQAPPTITISDADEAQAEDSSRDDTVIPGSIPDALAAAIPDWYRVGWRAVGGIDKEASLTHEEVEKGVLAAFIQEQYYGAAYHNAGVIFFAVIMTHFLTLFRFGWGSLIILLAFCSTYYTTSLARHHRRARDDIQRELIKPQLLAEHESVEWMNHFLDRFWLIYEPVLSATIISSVDQILSTNTPPFLDSLRLTTFTLGSKAPRIDNVRTFPNTPDDEVVMEWGISFTPHDKSNLTEKQALAKTNPKIVLSVRVGKGFASAGMPILLEDITLKGLLRVRMKLMTNFPHIRVVNISFTQRPFIDYVLKPIGGEAFGFDIANIPGLAGFIRDMTHSTLGPMMYDPNVFTLNLEQLLSGTPLDAAIGVLQVTIHSARGLKGTKIGGGTPDPYVSLSISHRAELARTKHMENTYNPTWHETKFILVNSLAEFLTMTLLDYNDHRKDSVMGTASFELTKLQEDATQEKVTTSILRDGKDKGELCFDVSFYPVLTPKTTNGETAPVPETSVGIVRLTIHQAKDLDHSKSLSGDLNPYTKVILLPSRTIIHSTPRFKHTNNPVWESSIEFLCLDRGSSKVLFEVIDDRDFLSDPVVGYTALGLDELLEGTNVHKREWWPLSGCRSGRMRFSVEWKPLNMAGSLQSASRYVPPIGIVRLLLSKAVDVKNVEAALGGKSDPYVRVLSHNITMARTEVVNNNLNPEWDKIVYVPIHSLKDILYLECMDYQHLTKDRTLGSVPLALSDLATESGDKRSPYTSQGKREYAERIRLDKGMHKGTLYFTAEFIPAVSMKGITFEAPSNEIQQSLTKVQNAGKSNDSSKSSGVSSSSVEDLSRFNAGEDHASAENGQPHPKREKTPSVSSLSVKNANAEAASVGSSAAEESSTEGVEMSKEELLVNQSGIIIFNLIGGKLAKKAHLEVMIDEAYWPSVVTPKSRSTQARFDQVGEGFVKELDFSKLILRLNENSEDEKESVIAGYTMNTKDFLDLTLDGPHEFILSTEDGRNESTVNISAKYMPVNITLEPREKADNHGELHVELLGGRGIIAADRSGKSDPFAVFTLNGQKIFRSQVKKKTLTPEWNEAFDMVVQSRVGAEFEVEVFDWNQIEQAKSLGVGVIDLESLEPLQRTSRTILLSTEKQGTKGEIRIDLLFKPEMLVKTRKATSTFSAAGRAMTQVGGIPLGAGKGIMHGVGSAGRTVKGVLRRGQGSRTSLSSLEAPQVNASEAMPSVQGSQAPRGAAATAAGPLAPGYAVEGGQQPSGDYGTLTVGVLSAQDLASVAGGDTVRPYVVIKAGDKEQKTKYTGKTTQPEWDESFKFSIGPETKTMSVTMWDHKTIGKDRFMGEVEVEIWSHIKSFAPATDIQVDLKEGQGNLRLHLEFEKNRPTSASVSSLADTAPSPSKLSSLRKSLTRDRI